MPNFQHADDDLTALLQLEVSRFASRAGLHLVELYREKRLDGDLVLQADPQPAWKQRIPDPHRANRPETPPSAQTRARLRAKRRR